MTPSSRVAVSFAILFTGERRRSGFGTDPVIALATGRSRAPAMPDECNDTAKQSQASGEPGHPLVARPSENVGKG